MVCGLSGLTRERNVPSDASATRGGGETVLLVECSFTVAKAGTTSDVQCLGRMNAACEATVRLLARLRPFAGEGAGGRVAGLDSWGCWISSVRHHGLSYSSHWGYAVQHCSLPYCCSYQRRAGPTRAGLTNYARPVNPLVLRVWVDSEFL
jgi:hypothetical protein